MNATIVWVLTFTILGPVPEHGQFAKYNTKQECLQALQQTKETYKSKQKQIVATCNMVSK